MNYSEQEKAAYQKALLHQLYQQSYYEFFKDAVAILEPNTVWNFNWHHEYLCDLLQQEAFRIRKNKPKTNDYNINIPPRTSKSLIVSVIFNAWVWAASFLCISHTDDLAIELATKTKLLIESDWYQSFFPEVQLRPDSQAKANFKTTRGGSRVSFSMGSGVTGFGADYLIIDDATKPNQSSPAFLDQIIKTYRETLFNRLNNPQVGVRIIIGQRVAENDLSGYIKSNNQNGKYLNICLSSVVSYFRRKEKTRMKANTVEDSVGYMLSGGAVALSLADVNTYLTTAILVLTVLWWIRKHWNFKKLKDKE